MDAFLAVFLVDIRLYYISCQSTEEQSYPARLHKASSLCGKSDDQAYLAGVSGAERVAARVSQ